MFIFIKCGGQKGRPSVYDRLIQRMCSPRYFGILERFKRLYCCIGDGCMTQKGHCKFDAKMVILYMTQECVIVNMIQKCSLKSKDKLCPYRFKCRLLTNIYVRRDAASWLYWSRRWTFLHTQLAQTPVRIPKIPMNENFHSHHYISLNI